MLLNKLFMTSSVSACTYVVSVSIFIILCTVTSKVATHHYSFAPLRISHKCIQRFKILYVLNLC